MSWTFQHHNQVAKTQDEQQCSPASTQTTGRWLFRHQVTAHRGQQGSNTSPWTKRPSETLVARRFLLHSPLTRSYEPRDSNAQVQRLRNCSSSGFNVDKRPVETCAAPTRSTNTHTSTHTPRRVGCAMQRQNGRERERFRHRMLGAAMVYRTSRSCLFAVRPPGAPTDWSTPYLSHPRRLSNPSQAIQHKRTHAKVHGKKSKRYSFRIRQCPFQPLGSYAKTPYAPARSTTHLHTFPWHLTYYCLKFEVGSTSHLMSLALVIPATVVWPLSGSGRPSRRHRARLRCPPSSQSTPALALPSKSRGLGRGST